MNKTPIQVYVIAGVLIEQEGRFLLIQEKKPEVYGQWNLPAGKVDVGETIEEAAIREAKEECGYDVELIRKIGIYQKEATKHVKHAFLAKIIGGELRFPDDEILDAKWFTVNEIKDMKDQVREGWAIQVLSDLKMI